MDALGPPVASARCLLFLKSLKTQGLILNGGVAGAETGSGPTHVHHTTPQANPLC